MRWLSQGGEWRKIIRPSRPRTAWSRTIEAHLRRVLVRLMESEGFICHEAANGRIALDLLARFPAMLLLTDLHMPELDGMGLLREVRERQPDAAVIMITAVADVATAVSALSVGAMDYLTKPFHLDEVRARVRQALEKRRLILENRGYQLRLEARVAEQARRLESLFLASIQSLADALEVKDPYTHGHSLRVSHYSVAIARAIGLGDEVVREIEIGGRVHDIGKIGVREAVLNKPGPLTDDEYRHIMTHPLVGWRILSPLLDDVPKALNIVRWHHERYDGSGVPDGLAGDAVPDRSAYHRRRRYVRRHDERAPVPARACRCRRPSPSCGAAAARSSIRCASRRSSRRSTPA